jgi:hypothetical protein
MLVVFPSLEQLGLLIGAVCSSAALRRSCWFSCDAGAAATGIRSISMPRFARFVLGHRRSVLVRP